MLIGLTGGIASGKSTVSAIFKEMGCRVIDADLVAREVVGPGSPGLKLLAEEFGWDIIDAQGNLKRDYLGKLVFKDEGLRNKLNAILHPLIIKIIRERAAAEKENDGKSIIVVDAPLLIEVGLYKEMDYVVLVYADEETQKNRIVERDKLSDEEAYLRIKAQMPLAEKVPYAHFIIDNQNSRTNARRQVEKIMFLLIGRNK